MDALSEVCTLFRPCSLTVPLALHPERHTLFSLRAITFTVCGWPLDFEMPFISFPLLDLSDLSHLQLPSEYSYFYSFSQQTSTYLVRAPLPPDILGFPTGSGYLTHFFSAQVTQQPSRRSLTQSDSGAKDLCEQCSSGMKGSCTSYLFVLVLSSTPLAPV